MFFKIKILEILILLQLVPDASNDMYNWPENNLEEVSSEFLKTGKSKGEGILIKNHSR